MKKTELKTIIRNIVKEEVALAIKYVIKEMREPTVNSKKQKVQKSTEPIKKAKYTKNSVLNEMLNETANSTEWETLGDGTYTTDRMNEVMQDSYSNLMNQPNGNTNPDMVASMDVDPNTVPDYLSKALNRDYSEVMTKINEKTGRP
ncbi:hypothetical protein CMI37_02120 [Candidatus Pacearchaeota archaeon]|nr:hypothetical protein [Candidatus Pacearchaeota archaeon]